MIAAVGLLSPGDMGHSIGQVLHYNGLRLITNLTGRSSRSRELAAEAGIEDIGDDQQLVQEAEAAAARSCGRSRCCRGQGLVPRSFGTTFRSLPKPYPFAGDYGAWRSEARQHWPARMARTSPAAQNVAKSLN